MTCAHVVHVALKKLPGVDSVDVSLNKGLATAKLKPGNSLAVPLFWKTIHDSGYTPKATVITVRGVLGNSAGRLQLQVSGTTETLVLVADPKSPAVFEAATSKHGQTVVLSGVMMPAKDLRTPVPLMVDKVD